MDNKYSYQIEVNLYPSNEYEPDKPCFWCLRSRAHTNNSDWCMENAGWSATPEEAWSEAYRYYQKYYEGSCKGVRV